MSATIAGGKKAAISNKERYGEDFYSKIGKKGGSTPTTKPKGYAAMTPEQRREAGKKGGSVSKRGKANA